MKAGTKDEFNLISQFSLGLDQKLTEMILSMSSVPTTSKGWINQSKIFHTQLVHIRDLCQGRTPSHNYTPSCSHHDPNAMDVDAVSLSKLTPVEHVKCMKEGRCFQCRKPGHNARNCRSSGTTSPSPTVPHPHQIRTTQTQAEPSKNPFTTTPKSALNEYVNSLKTSGKVSPISLTSSLPALKNQRKRSLKSPPPELWIFKQGRCFDVLFPYSQSCTCSKPQQ